MKHRGTVRSWAALPAPGWEHQARVSGARQTLWWHLALLLCQPLVLPLILLPWDTGRDPSKAEGSLLPGSQGRIQLGARAR